MSRPLRSAATLAIGLAIFVGLPLIGWGLRDLARFLADPVRSAWVAAVLLLNSYAAITNPEVGKPRRMESQVVARQRLAVRALQLLPLALVVLAPYGDAHDFAVIPAAEGVRVLGLALYAAGFLLMHWAEVKLGRLYSVQVAIQDGHRLVIDGPYRYVRHPRYLGIVVFLCGSSLVFRSWLALSLVAISAGVLLWRIRDEEGLLRRHFGPDWEAYARKSWRMVPFVF